MFLIELIKSQTWESSVFFLLQRRGNDPFLNILNDLAKVLRVVQVFLLKDVDNMINNYLLVDFSSGNWIATLFNIWSDCWKYEFRINFTYASCKSQTKRSRYKCSFSLNNNISSINNVLDMRRDWCISSYSMFFHVRNQGCFCQIWRRFCKVFWKSHILNFIGFSFNKRS